jgi:type IV pilus assembly protein PilW
MKNKHGMTLIELLIVLAIFGVVMAGLYSAYSVQLKTGIREYRLGESEIELQIAKSMIERDLGMAGFGLADTYCDSPSANSTCVSNLICGTPLDICVPRAASATNVTPDTLTLMGTALGRGSRAAQEWSYAIGTSPSAATDFKAWDDASYPTEVTKDIRENLKADSRIIYIEPNAKKFLVADGNNGVTGRRWLFTFPPSDASTKPIPDNVETGVLAIGLQSKPDPDSPSSPEYAAFPYYVVRYYLGGTPPKTCAPNTLNLLRAESITTQTPGGQPLLNCVLDFQVAFGLDTNDDKVIDCWDDGGTTAAGYDDATFRKRIKQIRVYALVQSGNRDENYVYSNPEDTANPAKIRVGDVLLTTSKCGGAGIVGHDYTLSDEQRKYRWRVVTVSVAPRNIRE